jgi:hypothetical protein
MHFRLLHRRDLLPRPAAVALGLLVLLSVSPSGILLAQPIDPNVIVQLPGDVQFSNDRIFQLVDEPAHADVPLLAQRIGRDNLAGDNYFQPERSRDSDGGIDGPNARLIDRTVDPLAWLMNYRFRQAWNWPIANTGLDNQSFEIRPTVPFKLWDQANLLRVTVPYNYQGAGPPGLSNVQVFHMLIFSSDSIRWGFGPSFQFDPSSTPGQNNFQAGPACGAITKTEHWTVGFLCQNFLSGNNSQTEIQPLLAYKFNDQFAVGIGDMIFVYDWSKSQWPQVPLGVGAQYIADICGQKMEFFANPLYNLDRTASNSGWTLYVGIILLVPGAK